MALSSQNIPGWEKMSSQDRAQSLKIAKQLDEEGLTAELDVDKALPREAFTTLEKAVKDYCLTRQHTRFDYEHGDHIQTARRLAVDLLKQHSDIDYDEFQLAAIIDAMIRDEVESTAEKKSQGMSSKSQIARLRAQEDWDDFN